MKEADDIGTATGAGPATAARAEALMRMGEAEDTLRAIGAGEVDAFVVSDGEGGHRVFTLSTADRPYRMFVENMRDGAATVAADGRIMYANQRLADLVGWPREAIVGAPLARFVADGAPIAWEQLGTPGGAGATVEVDLVDVEGRAIPVVVGASPLALDGSALTCLTFTDLSAQKAQDDEIARLGLLQAERLADLQSAQAALTRQATHDPLTGLPNRLLLVDRIEQALSRARRSGRCVAVLFVDLDRFKVVNDTHGHAAGDRVLQHVAERLGAVVRPMDSVARLGGDEFVVLAPDVDSSVHAVELGERIVAELARRSDPVEDTDRVSGSVGISVSVAGTGTAESMLGEADTAMYQAKSLGGGRAEVFDAALGLQVLERAVALGMVRTALDDDRVVVHYQPVVELADQRITGFEALARIVAADGSLLAPSAFIPVAEDSGLVVPLGTHVLDRACRDAAGWPTAGPLSVAVNLSARQFEPGTLTTLVRDLLELTALDPGRLHLELTETAVIDLLPDLVSQLGRLRALGVEIGLDDFGTGYASLTHLRRLPLTFVKIDQSFVRGLGDDREDERIVAAVVDLARNLGLRSIAEGVETRGQLERLRDLGCDQAQGFLFARAMPAEAVGQAVTRS